MRIHRGFSYRTGNYLQAREPKVLYFAAESFSAPILFEQHLQSRGEWEMSSDIIGVVRTRIFVGWPRARRVRRRE